MNKVETSQEEQVMQALNEIGCYHSWVKLGTYIYRWRCLKCNKKTNHYVNDYDSGEYPVPF